MIKPLTFEDDALTQRALQIQKAAYRIEADLIGFDAIPALHESAADLQKGVETFIGYFVDDVLAGHISYAVEGDLLDIGRLVVDPAYFRRGIARALVAYVEKAQPGVKQITVSTGADNTPARQLYERVGYTLQQVILLPQGVCIAQYLKLVATAPQ